MLDVESAKSVLEPYYDCVYDAFAEFEVEPGRTLLKRSVDPKTGEVRRPSITWRIDPSIRNSDRHYAGTHQSGKQMLYAPETVELPLESIIAILCHEFGHALDFMYAGCFSWPIAEAGPVLWIGEEPARRAQAWRMMFGDPSGRSKRAGDDTTPAVNFMRAWEERNKDQVEWAADGIAWLATGKRPLYCGEHTLQCYTGGEPRPAGLR